MKSSKLLLLFLFILIHFSLSAQHSVARQWNEQVLEAIRNDFARPTVHARNLFHTSVAMYDAWAVYESSADTYFLGKVFPCHFAPFEPIPIPGDVQAAQEEAMSFAIYRLILHRFKNAPGVTMINEEINDLMANLGYNINNTSLDYHRGPAELGNYIANQLIRFGHKDGSNEINDYQNRYYEPINPPLNILRSGNPDIQDLNRWQPLQFGLFIDQAGNPIEGNTPEFLSPEWGAVLPFSMQEEDLTEYERDGFTYPVYHDPGPPEYLTNAADPGLDDNYRWGHSLVAIWSSHLDPNDTTRWDISPAALGNITEFPNDVSDYPEFYNLIEGGDTGMGYPINPKTGMPYEPNIVLRADYARILAEFWADGPDSETPPGHWYTILNTVNDHPDLEKRFMGAGEILDDLEWDVKAYFILGGTMHDVAISAWGIKGWYDYVRPVSAIRGMAERGQSSDPNLPSYNPLGLPLVPGFIELIEEGDSLAGFSGEFVGDIKLNAWKGPRFILDPDTDVAGVGWIRAANWWPYQRPTFVTPPFAGYVSGHSTYSRAAAEVLTALTGDPFFPGGVGEFFCPKNEFLVFEEGPSEDVTLQWATYRDASDQCSLSRIWGGIHPPVDDIPGRLIGEKIGIDAFNYAVQYFSVSPVDPTFEEINIYPNPTDCLITIEYEHDGPLSVQVFQIDGKLMLDNSVFFSDNKGHMDLNGLSQGIHVIVLRDNEESIVHQDKVVLKY